MAKHNPKHHRDSPAGPSQRELRVGGLDPFRDLKLAAKYVGAFVGFAVVAVLGVVAVVLVYSGIETARAEAFYTAHPMLREMAAAPPSYTSRTDDPWPRMTDILLKHVPTGTSREDALRILSAEKLSCSPSASTKNLLICQAHLRPSNVTRWWIEVRFDEVDRVSGGRVLALKAAAT
jgi:hypothetical protein